MKFWHILLLGAGAYFLFFKKPSVIDAVKALQTKLALAQSSIKSVGFVESSSGIDLLDNATGKVILHAANVPEAMKMIAAI